MSRRYGYRYVKYWTRYHHLLCQQAGYAPRNTLIIKRSQGPRVIVSFSGNTSLRTVKKHLLQQLPELANSSIHQIKLLAPEGEYGTLHHSLPDSLRVSEIHEEDRFGMLLRQTKTV